MNRLVLAAAFGFGAWLFGSIPQLKAQSADAPPRLDLSVGPAAVLANEAHWGVVLGARWQLPGEFRQLSIGAVGLFAPPRADSTSPGVSSLGLDLVLSTRDPVSRPAFAVLVSFGVAETHLDARRQETALAACLPQEGCMAEGVVDYHTGTYITWAPGLAVFVRLTPRVALRPQARVLFTRDDPTIGTQSVVSFDLSVTWRP